MITIGKTRFDGSVSLPLRYGNRHGLVAGATGTGKTVTLQRLAEEFSRAGVPVFAADIKGDLSGIAATGDPSGNAARRSHDLGVDYIPSRFPVTLWDIFGKAGFKITTSVQEIGPRLMALMLGLNPTQTGAIDIAFRFEHDRGEFLLGLDDLRYALNDMLEDRETVCQRYGNVTGASISAIQRNILALESQGGDEIFGEPGFDIMDFMQTRDGRGVVNLLHADQLMEAPKLYATFLLWLLTKLFRRMPEVGDLDKPKLVFFFDEAHLLFRDTPKPLMDQIERLVRLIRSKGVGVYFVTQKPSDVPDAVLAQLGNRIQHALRVFTPKEQRFVKSAAQAFRPNPKLDVKAEITEMGTGEALISVMEDEGIPSVVQKIKVFPPSAQIGPISELERQEIMDHHPLRDRYAARLPYLDQFEAFVQRMRAERGMPEIELQREEWTEGEFRKFIPDISPRAEAPKRRQWSALEKARTLLSIAASVAIFAYLFHA